jgi:hypothetical protein
MCFSATASFITAGVTAACGAFALGHTAKLRELPLASIPFVFAAQQGTEGLLWLTLDGRLPPTGRTLLVNGFVAIALSLWPVLIPVSVALIERRRTRRTIAWCIAVVGAALSALAAGLIFHHPFGVSIQSLRLCYISPVPFPIAAVLIYVLCACAPLLITSEPALKPFGFMVAAGMIVSAAFYFLDFISVWCFFAAASSVTICLYYRGRLKRSRRILQPAT